MAPERRFPRRKVLIAVAAGLAGVGFGGGLKIRLKDADPKSFPFDSSDSTPQEPTQAPNEIVPETRITPGLVVPSQKSHPDVPEGPKRQETEIQDLVDYGQIRKELREIIGQDNFREGIAQFEEETVDIRLLKKAIGQKNGQWVVYGIGSLAEFARKEAKVDERGFLVLPPVEPEKHKRLRILGEKTLLQLQEAYAGKPKELEVLQTIVQLENFQWQPDRLGVEPFAGFLEQLRQKRLGYRSIEEINDFVLGIVSGNVPLYLYNVATEGIVPSLKHGEMLELKEVYSQIYEWVLAQGLTAENENLIKSAFGDFMRLFPKS